ncbi:MAG: Crp/Fnr family transcriptional regulator [Candidatus Korobacteraceae bacterium]
MTTSELTAFVRKLDPPFLAGLDLPEINAVLAAARQRRFLANSVITNQGHPASHLFMILSGGARSFFLTPGGQKLQMHSYPVGEMFGGMALLSRTSDYLLSTEAVKDSHTLVWEHIKIRSLAERYPRMLDNALTIASDYLNVSIAAQVALSCHTARQRLAEVLVNLASGIGHRVSGGIELAVRNEELAAAANITPFTVSRVMSEWQRGGVLAKRRGKVLLPSPERLLLQDL